MNALPAADDKAADRLKCLVVFHEPAVAGKHDMQGC